MLATHLGTATRLTTLNQPGAADELSGWFTSLWGETSAPRRAEVLATLLALLDHWSQAGWVTEEVGARLREIIS
jgi:hypothetical protein